MIRGVFSQKKLRYPPVAGWKIHQIGRCIPYFKRWKNPLPGQFNGGYRFCKIHGRKMNFPFFSGGETSPFQRDTRSFSATKPRKVTPKKRLNDFTFQMAAWMRQIREKFSETILLYQPVRLELFHELLLVSTFLFEPIFF